MFKRIFGQGSGGGGGVGPKPSVTSTVRTVDAIQKLGEVSSCTPAWTHAGSFIGTMKNTFLHKDHYWCPSGTALSVAHYCNSVCTDGRAPG